MDRLGDFLLIHLDGIAAACDHAVRFGGVESINAISKGVLRTARGMRDEPFLELKLQWATARPIRTARDLTRASSMRNNCIQIGEERKREGLTEFVAS